MAIPVAYYSTQKIGAVTVILDARLKGKELEGVLKDADLKLLVVHQQLYPEVEEIFKTVTPIPVWLAGGSDERSFEHRFSALTATCGTTTCSDTHRAIDPSTENSGRSRCG